MHTDAIKRGERVVLFDDLIATGGTAEAACNLIEKLGGDIVECSFVIGLPDLKGKEKISRYPIYSLVEFEGE
jgi:adenine phosphoribosyltransferase